MYFEAPDAADLRNVRALNRAFFALPPPRDGAGPDAALRQRLAKLDSRAAGRLARTPFLLFSLRERDARRWEPLFSPKPAGRTQALLRPVDDEAQLAAAALGLIWQLARQCPYRARVVCGAPLDWCERLATTTFAAVSRYAFECDDLISCRFDTDRRFWDQLLTAGISDERAVRRAARMRALQCVLTQSEVPARRLPAAACALPAPAERAAVSSGERHGYNTRPHERSLDTLADQNLPERQ